MKTFLFDLDGTLLKMDLMAFIKVYYGSLVQKYGQMVAPELLIEALNASIKTMYANQGKLTNEEAFLNKFNEITNGHYTSSDFDDFYRNEFLAVKSAMTIDDAGRQLIDILKAKGYRLVLATNPIFPKIATIQRMGFIGLKEEDFDYITHYGNCHYTKPSLDYYRELLSAINEKPENCIMVGNDLDEDMVITELGADFVLLNDCMINKSHKEVYAIFNGTMAEFTAYAKENL